MYLEFNSNVIISLPEIIKACTVNLAAMTMMVVVHKSLAYMVADNTFQMLHIYNIKCHSIYPNCRYIILNASLLVIAHGKLLQKCQELGESLQKNN